MSFRRKCLRLSAVASALLTAAALFSSPSPAAAAPSYHAQGFAAGLTAQQVSWLQGQVDQYTAAAGGRQTSLNTVDINGKAELRVALPGEAHPRNFTTKLTTPCDGGAARGYLCLYRGTYGSGTQIAMYECTTINLPGWSGNGSWGNSQTPGTVSYYLGRYYGIADRLVAQGYNHVYNWTPVWHVQNC